MKNCLTEQAIENGQKVTADMVLVDIQNGDYICLYFATEKQIDELIQFGEISEDYASYWQDAQEEIRTMVAEFSS